MKTLTGILFTLFVLVVVAIMCASTFAATPGFDRTSGPVSTAIGNLPACPAPNGGLCLSDHPTTTVTTLHGDGTVTPAPLSAIAVTQCGLAVSLFVQLDATHLLRADPRQSDMFTAVDGKMVQSQAGPMKWDDALALAKSAVLSTNVTLPCTDVPSV